MTCDWLLSYDAGFISPNGDFTLVNNSNPSDLLWTHFSSDSQGNITTRECYVGVDNQGNAFLYDKDPSAWDGKLWYPLGVLNGSLC